MPASVQRATDPALPKSTSSGFAVTTRMRSISSSDGIARTYPPLVDRRTRIPGIVRGDGEVATLAAQHGAPEGCGVGGEEVVGEGVDDEPALARELVVELAWAPPRVTGEHAHRLEVAEHISRGAPEVDGAHPSEQRLPRIRALDPAHAREADHRLVLLHRTAHERDRRPRRGLGPA